MSYGLALHTSSPALGLAISDGALDSRYQTWDLGRETSNYLHPYLLEFLSPQTWSDLGWIAVAKGPGGFTGTRLGVVTARTLAQQLNLPLFAISSLAAVVCCQDIPGTIAVSLPAGRGELYGAVYHRSDDGLPVRSIFPDGVFTLSEWETKLIQLKPDYHHQIAAGANLADTVTGVIALAARAHAGGEDPHWSTALPFYGQHPVRG
jgi:tRNA threonylcarbamoyl adenosine modification protein YeaZ